MKKYIKWLQYSIGLIVFLIFAISIFNYKIDSLGIFGNNTQLEKAAKTLINGNMISGLRNYDERLFQKLVIQNLNIRNDAIAIGSSRTMQLRKRYFLNSQNSFFNHSVSSANINDFISIIGLYEKEKGYIPRSIIIGIDPWMFNKNIIQNRWRTLQEYYYFEMSKMGLLDNFNKSYFYLLKQLINYEYTIENIRYYFHLLKNGNKLFYITKIINDDMVKETDGSIHYKLNHRNPSIEKVNEVTKFYISHKNDFYKFDRLDNIKKFESFIDYLRLRDINISFLLAPINPMVYNKIKFKNDSINKTENYLRNYANKNKITLYGSYNPNMYNFDKYDFIDALHCKDNVIKILMKGK